MKIEYRKGDLFKTDITHIVHGCNCRGVMGSGVAKIIKEEYPEAFSHYLKLSDKGALNLGDIQIVKSNNKIIINALTQFNYGRDDIRYANYEAIAKAFEKINDHFYLISEGIIAMPMIGAGLANGDWNVISAIIESELTVVKPVVYQL
jgi:O-acetyl-ADP-ribose deacetylase (regulator of RNase III)